MMLTIKLTRSQQAAAKRMRRLDLWRTGERRTYPYTAREFLQDVDRRALADAVLEAIEKGGA